MPQLEERMARVEGILEQMGKRMDDLRNDVGHLKTMVIGVWGTIVVMWVTVILTTLLKG